MKGLQFEGHSQAFLIELNNLIRLATSREQVQLLWSAKSEKILS